MGYLFFGAPNERSTVVPPRDFYLYFIQPYESPRFRDEKKADEVFFRLTGRDDAFHKALKGCAAALDLVRDVVNAVGSAALAARFEDEAPEYPRFPAYWTAKSRPRAAQDALRWIAGPRRTQQGSRVLDALELLDGDRLDPTRSRYARHVVELLERKGQGQVLDRGEFIQAVHDVEYMSPGACRLEPEWVVVVLASLVYSGHVALAIPGRKFDATDVASLAATPLADIVELRHVERPKDWDVPALAALFELLELTPGMAQLVAQGKDEPVRELQKAVDATVNRLVTARQALGEGLYFWGRRLLDEQATDDLRGKLDAARDFLEPLQAFSSPGALKHFRHGRPQVEAQRGGLHALREFEALRALAGNFANAASYFPAAEAALPPDHEWIARLRAVREDLFSQVVDPAARSAAGFRQRAQRKLADLKRAYIDTYLALHARARLDVDEDRRKGRLLADGRLQQLKALATIDLLPRQQLDDSLGRVTALQSCPALTEHDLAAAAECPHCAFRPGAKRVEAPTGSRLAALDGELNTLLSTWTDILLSNLGDPGTAHKLDLLPPDQRASVQAFMASRLLPARPGPGLHRRGRAGPVRPVEGGRHHRRPPPGALPGRSPATPGELKQRFGDYVDEKAKGLDEAKVRIVIE